jgi:hypothetical protein
MWLCFFAGAFALDTAFSNNSTEATVVALVALALVRFLTVVFMVGFLVNTVAGLPWYESIITHSF